MRKSLILSIFFAHIASFALGQKVNVNIKNEPISSVFKKISKQTKLEFFYSETVFDSSKKVSVSANNIEAMSLIGQIIGNKYKAELVDKNRILIVLNNSTTNAISKPTAKSVVAAKVTGVVKNAKGEALIGATVWCRGTRFGSITDAEGKFEVEAKKGDVLVIDYVGYERKEITITDESKYLEVVMVFAVSKLDEVKVVSTGYQKIDNERSTGSVSVVTAKDLEKIPVSNVMHQLEGQVSGLAVDILDSDNTFVYGRVFGDGAGSTSYNFRIRGQSTYRSNGMPLIVLDGTPTELDIRTLNPADIEKITFLKDAAAASIYGVRSANGVMVIETKKGKLGKSRISVAQNYSISAKPNLASLPLMNSSQVLNLEQELVDKGLAFDPNSAFNLFSAIPISQGMEIMFQEKRGTITAAEKNAKLDILRNRSNYDQIQKYLIQPAESSNYNISLSGGKDDYSYFTSAAFSKEKPNSVGDEGKRMTFTVNQDFKLFKSLKLSTSLKGSFFNYLQNGLGLSPLNASLTTLLPYDQLVDDNGKSVDYFRTFYSKNSLDLQSKGYLPWTYNFIDELKNSNKETKENNYSANIALTLPLFKGLEAVGTYYIENSDLTNTNIYNDKMYYTRDLINLATYLNPNTNALTFGLPKGGIYQSTENTRSSYTARGQLNYDLLIADKHKIDALGGVELRQVREQISGRTLYGYNENTQTSIDIPSINYTSVYGFSSSMSYGNTQKDQRRRFLSYYSNAAYSFDNKYVISGSVRLDDYNNFGVDKSLRRTPLWSTGAKWNVFKEAFMNKASFVSNLSLRLSYGYNGNISLTTYPFTNISLAATDSYSQLPFAFISAAANPTLRWEKTGVFNVGVDFGFFNSRLNGSFEYYKKNSKDLIQEFPVSPFYGLPNNSLTRNTATLVGHGIDLNLNGVLVRNNDFGVDLNLVTSYNTNEVTDSRYTSYTSYLNGTGSTPPIVGYGLNSIFAFRSAGLDANGRTQIYDKQGNIVAYNKILTDIEDMKYMGTSTPQYYGSISSNIRFHKLSLYLLATYKLDYVLFKPTFQTYVDRYGSFSKYDLNQDIDNRWRVPGDEAKTTIPGVQGMSGYSHGRYYFSDNRVIDGDHIRFREISLKYDLSSYLKKTFINNASLTFAARNLGIIWRKNKDNIDPDFLPYTGGTIKLPPVGMYTLGLNVNF
ncbi:SusC/RagA family TonB-linked outer membrane protein [Flavobacterium sp. MAHUQ-51]|uniref:SusC/RagA family TonB-linked outer membrane protein n=1 Tax=Flavobacterium sp. GCM10022190 TaxID=3252639 RepID=UPI003609F101